MHLSNHSHYNNMSPAEAYALPEEVVLQALDIDELYYGKFGQNWYSNSHLSRLLDDPHLQKEDEIWANGMYLVIGNFVHKAFLEPEKAAVFPYSKAKNRHEKLYKEDLAESNYDGWMFCEKDFIKWNKFRDDIMSVNEVADLINADGNEFEVPQIAMFNGLPIKGKCDIINHKTKMITDIKTTSDLDNFASKIDDWNYNLQATLYAKGLYKDYGFTFIAMDKKTNQVGVFVMSAGEFEVGLRKLYKCTNLFKHYHVKGLNTVYYHYV